MKMNRIAKVPPKKLVPEDILKQSEFFEILIEIDRKDKTTRGYRRKRTHYTDKE